jgi:hypothetical protein
MSNTSRMPFLVVAKSRSRSESISIRLKGAQLLALKVLTSFLFSREYTRISALSLLEE